MGQERRKVKKRRDRSMEGKEKKGGEREGKFGDR